MKEFLLPSIKNLKLSAKEKKFFEPATIGSLQFDNACTTGLSL